MPRQKVPASGLKNPKGKKEQLSSLVEEAPSTPKTEARDKAINEQASFKAKVASESELKDKIIQLGTEIKNIQDEELEQLKTKFPDLEGPILIHRQMLHSKKVEQDRLAKLEPRSLTTEKEALETIIRQHKKWKEIIVVPLPKPTNEVNDVKSSDLNQVEDASDYLSKWEIRIKEMPEIGEKEKIKIDLGNLKKGLQFSKERGEPKENKVYIELFEKQIKDYDLLLKKIDTAKKLDQLILEASQCLDEWQGIRGYKTTTPERRETINFLSQQLTASLQTSDVNKIEIYLKQFKTEYMLRIKRKVVPEAIPLIETILARIDRIEQEMETDKPKNKKSLPYKTHELNALRATVDYLENKPGAYGNLTNRLKVNKDYDKAPAFSRSQTKNLIIQACLLQGDAFPDPKAKQKQQASSVNNQATHRR